MPSNPRRILVVRTDRIGDVVLATPLIRALRRSFPVAWIAAMVRPYAEPVLRHNPYLNEIITDDHESADAGTAAFLRQVRRIRKGRFDTALILLPKSRLSWMLFLAGVRRRVSVGHRLDHLLTFTQWVTRSEYRDRRHEADYCLDLGRKIGVEDDGPETEVYVTREEQARARSLLRKAGVADDDTLIGIHPMSRGSAPNWVPDRYAELADLLLEGNVKIILTGSESEGPLLKALAERNRSRIVPVPGADLRQTIGVISLLQVLVSASTGPMHLAAGLRVPTVSLFCPLTACAPARWRPLGNHAEILLPVEGYCEQRCPGDPHVCTFEGGIAPGDVATAVRRALNAGLQLPRLPL